MLGLDFNGLAEVKRYASQFEQLGKIGKGGYSTVYKARHRLDGKLYAIKKIRMKPMDYRSNLQEQFEKILRQGKVLCQIDHPNVLKYHAIWFEVGSKTGWKNRHQPPVEEELELVIDSDEFSDISFEKKEPRTPEKLPQLKPRIERNKSDKKEANNYGGLSVDYKWLLEFTEVTVYIQSELCKESLDQFVDRRRQSAESANHSLDNYRMVLQLVDGIESIHARKIIHRDLKLQNVLVNFKGTCKICDFGVAKRIKGSKSCYIINDLMAKGTDMLTEDDLDKFSSSVGTKIFSSPEQSNGSSYDHRADIFSLGLLIGMLFSRWNTKHEEYETITKLRAKSFSELKLDDRIVGILDRCLSEPQFRPTLKQLRKSFTDMLYPPMCISLRLAEQPNFASRTVLSKKGVIYIGQDSHYTKMHRIKNLTVEASEQCYTVSQNGRRLFEVGHSAEATELITTILSTEASETVQSFTTNYAVEQALEGN